MGRPKRLRLTGRSAPDRNRSPGWTPEFGERKSRRVLLAGIGEKFTLIELYRGGAHRPTQVARSAGRTLSPFCSRRMPQSMQAFSNNDTKSMVTLIWCRAVHELT